jgi:hypothetical protein
MPERPSNVAVAAKPMNLFIVQMYCAADDACETRRACLPAVTIDVASAASYTVATPCRPCYVSEYPSCDLHLPSVGLKQSAAAVSSSCQAVDRAQPGRV